MLRNSKTSFLRYIGYLRIKKARFIANSSSCTTELSKLLTYYLATIKTHVIGYCEKVYEKSCRNLFWPIKYSDAVLNKLESRGLRAYSCQHMIFLRFINFVLWFNQRKSYRLNWEYFSKGRLILSCLWWWEWILYFWWPKDGLNFPHVKTSYFLDNIFISFGTRLYRQIVGIPMGINCAHLAADLFLFR